MNNILIVEILIDIIKTGVDFYKQLHLSSCSRCRLFRTLLSCHFYNLTYTKNWGGQSSIGYHSCHKPKASEQFTAPNRKFEPLLNDKDSF